MLSEKIDSVDNLIVALCLDYFRRKSAIEEKSAPKRVDTEFRYLNFKMFDAAAEIAGEGMAEKFIYEIGKRIGYAKSALSSVSESTYKTYKSLIKANIAKKLYLVAGG